MNISQPGTPNRNNTTISQDDLVRLENLYQVGLFASDMLTHQTCTTFRTPPMQQAQLASLIHLITDQLGGVVERCNHRWLTGEASA